MKLSQKSKEWILHLKQQGFGSRHIANLVGCSKSTVNNFLGSLTTKSSTTVVAEVETIKVKTPNILLFDLESAPSIVATFKRWQTNIGPESVIREGGYIISACWKFLGEEEMTKVVQTPEEAVAGDDSRIVAELYEAFEKADIVVGHNGKRFDVPLFKTRLIANGMPPPKTVKIVDTLLIAKKLKFNSNKLDSLGHYLEVGRKVEHSGMPLWLRCMEGDKESLAKMLEYNAQDVHLLEEVYLKLRAFDMLPPNLGLYFNDGEHHCPVCASTDLTYTGNSVYTAVSEFEEIACNDCGHRSRIRKSKTTSDQRATLLMSPKQ